MQEWGLSPNVSFGWVRVPPEKDCVFIKSLPKQVYLLLGLAQHVELNAFPTAL